MEIYSREELDKQKIRKKRAKIIMAAVSFAALAVCVVLFCIVEPLNEKTCRIWAVVAASAAACFDMYVVGFVLPYLKPDAFAKSRSKAGRVLRNILRQLLLYLLCIILAAVFTTFIFNRITDTTADKKVSVFIDSSSIKSAEMENELDKDLPEGIKLVKVHSFDYDFFGFSGADEADIYIVRGSRVQELSDHLVPGAVPVYGNGAEAAASYIEYDEGEEYYLFLGKKSAHLEDGAAGYIVERLLRLK